MADVRFHECQTGPGIVKDRTLLLGTPRHVDGNGDCPKRTRGYEGFYKLRRIIEQKGDAVAARDAERPNNLGHLQRLRTQCAVSDLAPADKDGRRRRVVREDRVEKVHWVLVIISCNSCESCQSCETDFHVSFRRCY